MKVLSLLAFLIPASLFAQTGYKIDFTIKGLKDTTVILCYYYGDNTFISDTARMGKEGKFRFDGKKKLNQGMYFLVLEKNKLFDIVVGGDQQFAMETSTQDFIKNMKVTGDEDNALFFENMVYNSDQHKEADPYLKILKDSTLQEDKKKDARLAFEKINARVMQHQVDVIARHPTTLTARILKSSMRVEIPEPPKKPDGTIDSTFKFRYYREHFFDNFDLADEALIRMPRPVYQEKLSEYLDNLFLQTPDSIMPAINQLAARVKKNQDAYKYLVWTCMYRYQKPAIMGLDEVYVRLYDTYFASGEMDFWATPALKKSVKEHADKLRTSLIGMTGANLSMQDQHFQKRNLYDIHKKYTVIYFFDPDCGHCREESPKLVDFYNKNKTRFDLEVFAVCADTSISKMKEYIKEMKMSWITVNGPRSFVGQYAKLYYAEQTPTLYILDEKKKIIAKGLSTDRIELFLTNYQKYQQQKAALKGKGS